MERDPGRSRGLAQPVALASVALVASSFGSGVAGVPPSGAAGPLHAAGDARVTILAVPGIAPADEPITLYGAAEGARPGEFVEIESKDCGQSFFRGVSGTHTQLGGRWSAEFFPGITTQVRAVWNGRASKAVLVRQRARLLLGQRPFRPHEFVVSVVARAQFWRRTITIARYHPAAGGWRTFRRVVLTTQNAPGEVVWTTGRFTTRLPRGTRLRAVLPAAQAGPCYLSSTSAVLRT